MFKLKHGEKINWFRVTEDLRRLGYSTKDIHRNTGIPASTIRGWRLEIGNPRFEAAIMVLNFWCEKTGREADEVPIMNIYKPYHHYSSPLPTPKKKPKPKVDTDQMPLF